MHPGLCKDTLRCPHSKALTFKRVCGQTAWWYGQKTMGLCLLMLTCNLIGTCFLFLLANAELLERSLHLVYDFIKQQELLLLGTVWGFPTTHYFLYCIG
jgi:hypothetical protein